MSKPPPKKERDRQILGEEDSRRAADTAKTAKLREQRLAKEAAEREGAQKAKPRKDGERR